MAVLQADGNYDLEKNVNIGDAGDIWLPGMKLAPGDGKTFPNSDSYQGGNIRKTGVTIEVLELKGQNIDLQVIIQPTKTIKPGFRNSEGWMDPKPSEYQRTAPLPKSVPRNGSRAMPTKEIANPRTARRRTVLGDIMVMMNMVTSASDPNIACRST